MHNDPSHTVSYSLGTAAFRAKRGYSPLGQEAVLLPAPNGVVPSFGISNHDLFVELAKIQVVVIVGAVSNVENALSPS